MIVDVASVVNDDACAPPHVCLGEGNVHDPLEKLGGDGCVVIVAERKDLGEGRLRDEANQLVEQ